MRKTLTLAMMMLLLVSVGLAANVTFNVNIAHQTANGNFDPASDYVDVAGDFNGWGPAAGEWQLVENTENTAQWTATYAIDPGTYGFKFRINSSWDAGQHDGGDNRVLVVGDTDTEYFGYLDNFTMYPVVHFSIDLTDKFNLGEFDPTSDGVNVAGSFNGWDGAGFDLAPTPGNNLIWELYADQVDLFTTATGIEFKFRINQNWDNAESISNRTLTIADGLQSYVAFWNDYDYNLALTFNVNMNAMIDAASFDPATQYVDIAGNFNGWGGDTTGLYYLTDEDLDGIWTVVLADSFEVGQQLEYKFRIDSNWDTSEFPGGGSNRTYLVQAGAQSIDVWWNDFDPNFEGAPVTFKVNMNAQIDAATFDPATQNVLMESVLGAILMSDDNSDGIFELTEDLPLGLTFFHYSINGDNDESLPFDRSVMLTTANEAVILDVVWFSNVENVSHGAGNLTFRVDMTVLEALGFYNRALGDSLELRGGVNGWGSDPDRSIIDMIRQPGSETYFLTVPYEGDAGDIFSYKFFLNLHQVSGGDSAQHAGEDFYEYELPAAVGGGDRFFVWNGVNADTVLPVQTFQDYVTEGVIPEGESVSTMLYMDMSDAMALEDNAFDPAADDLYFLWQDGWGADLQGVPVGSIPADSTSYAYTPAPEMGENIWKLNLTINGPAPHAIMYTARYLKADGTEVSELGSGFGFGRFRTQWLKPSTVGGPLAPQQAFSVVNFSNAGTPLEVELEPYANGLTYVPVSVDEPVGLPSGFVLSQNYPNPFNPTTTISYIIPQIVDVRLTVFDITGREVVRLVDNKTQATGRYNIQWNGLNTSGEKVASGLYFYKIVAGDFQQTNKMMMLK
ncbi:MAG: T9SS type A sorting domain-containing protein [Candidatus Marinimicrobia bacterium]|nr:T9SS type A sorting domain-containing protein [Candidatus Neomarinimicrobiota bacterium]